ncbi:styrene monooxygenase/indole monooxygenase family protein [Streptomyces sp. NRRL S-31]|uniref:styrene monooxygenase/indole monooxygenase family protein n=1 Tax=Streptomyces sp. NRRL S-31 TaxID=1463898 RepID=UPI00069B231F|nr:styrene monooxygenase/indole monooxygenase family protein [Streptomyces sp. NRRL S-31]
MSIGIVGTGISGVHLALRLRQFGIDATLYTAQDPDGVRSGPPLNFVTRFHSTREREKALGLTEWASDAYDNAWMHLSVEAPGGPSFRAELPRPASSVDFRIYLAALLEEYQRRGGDTVLHKVTDRADLVRLAERHDLVVVAAGRGALQDTFPRDPARSPYETAPRHLAGGLFHGVRPPEPPGMTMHMLPGAGEVHAPTYHSFAGRVTVVLVEAVPGGPLTAITDRDHRDDPGRFTKELLHLIAAHVPGLHARIDEREFALTRPVDMLRGAVLPTVRRGWVRLTDDRCALAIGDAWITNDPLTAQGANLGSRLAFELADALREHDGAYDETFCRTVSEALWTTARPVVEWTNQFIGPPPPQMGTLLTAAAADQRVADAFVARLDEPSAMWRAVGTEGGTEEFIAQAQSVRSTV